MSGEQKRAWLEYVGCISKKAVFDTLDRAQVAAARIAARTGDDTWHGYSCNFCTKCHIGHTRPKGQRRNKAERLRISQVMNGRRVMVTLNGN